jgi:NAD-dependent dihydropyrimidine dehydrogenase PreA subunit
LSKGWYPVIDYEKCTECGVCFEKCPYGVYVLVENKPVVMEPENCIHGCRGCQKLCPAGAIDYVGTAGSTCGCDCSCNC